MHVFNRAFPYVGPVPEGISITTVVWHAWEESNQRGALCRVPSEGGGEVSHTGMVK